MSWNKRRNFVIRTIRNGRVRIFGKTFAPDPRHAYDGRLDGMRYAFGLYWVGDQWTGESVHLWGTERAYRSDDAGTDWPGPQCVDGIFLWDVWKSLNASTSPPPPASPAPDAEPE